MSVPEVQWYSNNLPVFPIPQVYQQIYVVPTNSPHTTTYTCVGTTHSEGVKTDERKVNIIVTVESKLICICDQILENSSRHKICCIPPCI